MMVKLKIKKFVSGKIRHYRKLRRSRKFGKIFFIVSILLFQVISLIGLSSVLSFSNLLLTMRFPAGFVNINLDLEPDNLLVQIPYKVENNGMFALTDITVSVRINVNYLNLSNSVNITTLLFSRTSSLPDVAAFREEIRFFEGDHQYFEESAVIDMFNYSDIFEPKKFILNLSFSSNYFMGLIKYSFSQDNIKL